jgi:nitrite reductase (NADH) large subunit
LALCALALLLSLRKRIRRVTFGEFSGWRVVHVIIGVLAVVTLIAHTGGRAGSNLNFALATSFAASAVLGATSSVFTAREARGGARGRSRRRWSTWMHLVALWPLPALLALHIVSAYYF